METEFIVVEERGFKAKVKRAKNSVKKKWNDIRDWMRENPEKGFLIVTSVAGVTCKAVANTVKHHRKQKVLDKEEDLKELYVYDRRLGHYWKLRRPLNNDEWLEVEKRKKEGEHLGDILEELKVLE